MRRLLKTSVALMLGAAALATGCASESTSTTALQPAGNGMVVSDVPTTKPSTGAQAMMIAPADGMIHGTLAYPTGDRATSTLLLEKAIPAEIVANKPYTYQMKVTNLTSQTLENVEIVESVPQGLSFGDKVDGATLQMRDNAAHIGLGSLKPGETKTLAIPATATAPGATSSCASVNYATSLCLGMNVVSPALKIESEMPPEILVCNSVPLKIKVTNSGTGTARNVKLDETLSEGLTTGDGQAAFSAAVGDIGAGDTKTIDVPLKMAKTGEYKAIAKITADDGLAGESTATTAARQPVLKLTKTGPQKVYIGVGYSYDITVENTGDAPASNLVVTDTLPAGVVATTASDEAAITGDAVVWNLGVLEKGGSKKLTLAVRGDAPGTARNSVSASAACAETKVVTADTELVGIPAILLEVVDEPDPVHVGDSTTYTITVTNQGSAPQTNVAVTADLEAQMEETNLAGVTNGKLDGTKITFDKLATLAPKAKATWTVTVKAKDVADVRFKVQMISDQITRPVTEDESTNFYQ